MDHSIIDEIKSKLDIVEVIGSYIKLQKAGSNYKALCPFHDDKNPSLFVSPSRQIWHCFGCGAGGDVFKFVMMIEGVEFGDALRILAKRAGVKLTRQNPVIQTQRNNLYDICETAAEFFEKQLKDTKAGKEAQEYLRKRGLNEESIKSWRLGYAPNVWHGLSSFLIKRGFKVEDIIKAGLALPSKENRPEFSERCYDRFRGRIMFPIFDLNSQVIAFTGRIFREKGNENMGKYVNTTNNLIFNKSKVLYGLNKAKLSIREKDACIIVEGQMDVILSYQVGVHNVVASSGTALTLEQLKILKRYSNNLITSFDMDVAGNSATKRGIDLAQSQGFNVSVITMPEGMDPADVASSNPEKWKKLVQNTKSILEFYFENTFAKFDSSKPQNKKKISEILLPVIKRIPNKIEQAYWVGELAKRLGVKEEAVEAELNKIALSDVKEERYNSEEEDSKSNILHGPKDRNQMLEERLLSLALYQPDVLDMLPKDDLTFIPLKIRKILFTLKKNKDKPFGNFSQFDFDEETKKFLNQLAFEAEINIGSSKPSRSDLREEFLVSLKELALIFIKKELNETSQKLKEAEKNKDDAKIQTLSKKFSNLTNKLIQYRSYEQKS